MNPTDEAFVYHIYFFNMVVVPNVDFEIMKGLIN